MKILFVNAYFVPEVIAFSHLEKDLIEGFVENGHEISVVCPIPTRGISDEIARAYQTKKKELMYDGRVAVQRFWAPREGRNPIVRAFRYLWCNIREYQIGRRYPDIDAVFAVSTPPTQGLLAGCLGKKLKCPVIYSLQDVFPDSLVTTGLATERSFLCKLGRMLEEKTYRMADEIITISDDMKQNLLSKEVPAQKIHMIHNWIDTNVVVPVSSEENQLAKELGLSVGTFRVVYAGNLGLAQGIDTLIEAAKITADDPEIEYLIFGAGVAEEELKRQAQGMEQVHFFPLQSVERVSEVYSLGDCSAVLCRAGTGGAGVPSKTWSIMACERPVLVSFDESELTRIVKEHGLGLCATADDAKALSEQIRRMKADIEATKRMGRHARAYVEKYAERRDAVSGYMEIIEKV